MCSKCPPPEHPHASERLLRIRPTFSETVMVSVGVSKLGCTELFFVEPGVTINLSLFINKPRPIYYRDVLLTQKLLPVIRQISGNEFVFQQNSAPTHRARETIELWRRETRWTLFHRNSGRRTVQILTRWITKSGLQCSSASTRQSSKCWRTATASAERLEQHWTRRHRRIHWPVACATQSMHTFGRQIFWTHAVDLSA